MKLTPVDARFIDAAWKEGAHKLSEACATSGGEVTGDQLKLLLSRGERILLRMDEGSELRGWGVVRIDQLPNVRVLHVCELYAPHGHFEEFFPPLMEIARSCGCSEVRCSAGPAQARLYRMKLGFEPLYETLRVAL
jgi:hypothetical protein